MDKKLRGIVDELLDYVPQRDRDLFIESRGQQVIASAVHLIKLMRESYEPALAEDLTKRLLRAISSDDEGKFCRGIKNLREAKTKRARPL